MVRLFCGDRFVIGVFGHGVAAGSVAVVNRLAVQYGSGVGADGLTEGSAQQVSHLAALKLRPGLGGGAVKFVGFGVCRVVAVLQCAEVIAHYVSEKGITADRDDVIAVLHSINVRTHHTADFR